MSEIKLTKEEEKHLNYLAQILDFASNELKEKVQKDSYSYFQNFLLFSFSPIHNFTEAIYVLFKDSRPHSAQVLLRSIFEACANIYYIKSKDTTKRLAMYAKDSFSTRKGLIFELESFTKKYPQLINKAKILNKENIEDLKQLSEKNIQAIEKGNNLTPEEKYPKHLIDRIRILDKEAPSEEAGMYELNYNIMYRQLSLFTHLNSWGLELFATQGQDSIEYMLGQDNEVDMIIAQVFIYYYDILNELYLNNVLVGKIPEIYTNWYEEMRSSN